MLNDARKMYDKLKQHFNCEDYEFIAFRVNDDEITFLFLDNTQGSEEFSISSTDKITDMDCYVSKKAFIELEDMGYVE